jgi:hypothetical protein
VLHCSFPNDVRRATLVWQSAVGCGWRRARSASRQKFALIGDNRRADKALSERVLASKNGAIGV